LAVRLVCGHDGAAAAGASAATSNAPARSESRGSAAMAAGGGGQTDRDLGRQVVEGSGSGGVGLAGWVSGGGMEGGQRCGVLAEATGRRVDIRSRRGAVRFRSQEVGGSLAGRDPLRLWGWSGQARRRGGGLVATAAGASHCVMPVGKHERVVATALRGKKKNRTSTFLRSF
jgi:hypothetical protein